MKQKGKSKMRTLCGTILAVIAAGDVFAALPWVSDLEREAVMPVKLFKVESIPGTP